MYKILCVCVYVCARARNQAKDVERVSLVKAFFVWTKSKETFFFFYYIIILSSFSVRTVNNDKKKKTRR